MKRKYYARRRKNRRRVTTRFYILIAVLVVALGVGIFFIVKGISDKPGTSESPGESAELTAPDSEDVPDVDDATDEPTATAESTPTPEPTLSADIVPQAVAETEPSAQGLTYELMVNGVEEDSYQSEEVITFGSGDEYTELEGVITFRGNNYRNESSYGYATVTEQTLIEKGFNKYTSTCGNWGGSGWTGQPLVVKWPEQTRQNMTTLYDEFRNKEDFVEVIVCSLDGYIYFMELSTGEKTRDRIYAGGPTKGTASLDPRGYPILYVGQGLNPEGSGTECNDMYYRAFSLIDGNLLMKFGAPSGDPFAYRNWQAYDSSALINGDADVLIVPGENGVLYIAKLNTNYDAEAGTVTMDMDPEKVKYRYTTTHNAEADSANNGRWGIEDSAVAWRNYLIFTDNAGILQCLDLNTMTPVYVNNLTDDSDVSMVLEEDYDNQTFYLYTGCEYDESVRNSDETTGTAYARKLNGLTGEVIWQNEYEVHSNNSVDGGILASPVLGKDGTNMEGLIIYNITQEVKDGSTTSRLVALNKEDGSFVWEYDMEVTGWSPSSPVPVYTEDGKGYIVQCDRDGDVALIDGETGEELDKISLKETNSEGETTVANNFEATPVVYENMIVVGSRSTNIFFIEIN